MVKTDESWSSFQREGFFLRGKKGIGVLTLLEMHTAGAARQAQPIYGDPE